MTDEQIKEAALAAGFKLKQQPDGSQDLNLYVYDFARKLVAEVEQERDELVEELGFLHAGIENGVRLKAEGEA